MTAPPFVPLDPVDRPRSYTSPDYVPGRWQAARPADIVGRQPSGPRLGFQGPDQGYALVLADRIRPNVVVGEGEHVEDAIAGCLGVALRRASLFGRAPVIHDWTVALTIWGFLDDAPPAELVALRRPLFEGVAHVTQHYADGRAIVDRVPEATLRLSHTAVTRAYPSQWRSLVGA
jgi:hypothetical protein